MQALESPGPDGDKATDPVNEEEFKKMADSLMAEDHSKELVKAACEAVGSLSDTEFEIRFNPDVYQPHVRHAEPEVRGVTSNK